MEKKNTAKEKICNNKNRQKQKHTTNKTTENKRRCKLTQQNRNAAGY